MATSGQTINDRLNAAKYILSGQTLARCICKATTEELIKPKKKHLDYLVAYTHEENVSMPHMANLLIERTNHTSWVVVYKSLITIHHVMSCGHERFTNYMASNNYSFERSQFLDRIVSKGYAMSPFISRYSKYINEKALAYRSLAVDLCKIPHKKDSIIYTSSVEELLKILSVVNNQLTTLLDFECRRRDITNGIITASLSLLLRDAIRLYATYNHAITRMFESYFDLDKKACRQAFEQYKKFLTCTERVSEFLKLAEVIYLDVREIPDFKRAPSSLLDAFEQHVLSLESNNCSNRNSNIPFNINNNITTESLLLDPFE